MKRIAAVLALFTITVIVVVTWIQSIDANSNFANDGYLFREVVVTRDAGTITLAGFVRDEETKQAAEAKARDKFPAFFEIDNRLGVLATPSSLVAREFKVRIERTDRLVVSGVVPDVRTLDFVIGTFRNGVSTPVVDSLRIVRGRPNTNIRAQAEEALSEISGSTDDVVVTMSDSGVHVDRPLAIKTM